MQEIGVLPGKKRKIAEVFIHILVWIFLFSFPLLFSTNEMPRSSSVFFRAWMPIFFSAIIFYINYFFLIDSLLNKKNLLWFIVANVLLFAISIYAIDLLRELLSPPREGRGSFRESKYYIYVTMRQVFSFALTVGVSFAIKSITKWRQSEIERRNLENENLKSELRTLKYQIQPHFFLNTLNNIYALTDISTDRAKEAIHSLGKLMRYLLYDTNTEQVSLQKEIDFMEKYIQLMKMRLRADVKVDYIFPIGYEQTMVAPLLMIPLVENAFKHGISASNPSFIRIELQAKEEVLVFKVENSNFPKDESDQGGSGIGLDNLKRRLKLLYGEHHEFDYGVQERVYKSQLKLYI